MYFITAISTDSGKSVVSAILTEALQADYFKPVQAGFPTDSETIKSLLSNPKSVVHTEGIVLQHPMSPHAAAEKENITISIEQITLPTTDNQLIVEGAGGLMVPINDSELIIDLIQKWDAEIILVSNNYLGSINHTLLSINEIRRRNLKLKGIVFNGKEVPSTESYILKYANVPMLFRLEQEEKITKETIRSYAQKIDLSYYQK